MLSPRRLRRPFQAGTHRPRGDARERTQAHAKLRHARTHCGGACRFRGTERPPGEEEQGRPCSNCSTGSTGPRKRTPKLEIPSVGEETKDEAIRVGSWRIFVGRPCPRRWPPGCWFPRYHPLCTWDRSRHRHRKRGACGAPSPDARTSEEIELAQAVACCTVNLTRSLPLAIRRFQIPLRGL